MSDENAVGRGHVETAGEFKAKAMLHMEEQLSGVMRAYRDTLLRPFEELAQKLADDQDRCSAPSHNIDVAIRELIDQARGL